MMVCGWLTLVSGLAAIAPGPALLPVDDRKADDTLLPAGVVHEQPQLFGVYVHVWPLQDGTQVFQYHGDFSLHLGQRRLTSQNAVVWMEQTEWEGTRIYQYDVYLSRFAYARDAAGTVTTGPVLFVTFNASKPAVFADDVHTTEPASETELYREASKIRQRIRTEGGLHAPRGDMEVFSSEPGAPRAAERPRAAVYFQSDELRFDPASRTVSVAGDVYVSQGHTDSSEFLEIRSDAAVLFLAERQPESEDELSTFPEVPDAPELRPFPSTPGDLPKDTDTESVFGLGPGLGSRVAGVYLRGDVVLTRGEMMIRASEIYYDFENDRALILDAVMRVMAIEREVPIYVRAEQARQLSTTEYFARNATLSTSEFHTPHVHLGVSEIRLIDRTPRDARGEITGFQAGSYEFRDATLNIEGVPIAYWPYAAGDFRVSETAIRSVRTAYSDDFGATFQSKWYLFNLLGVETPPGVDGTLRLDYFSKRGPGTGIDLDYEFDDSYGLFRGYYINDEGEDNLGPMRDGKFANENRGRTLVRHRLFLPDDWELTIEGSYISDPNFLEEYFNAEWEEGKEQETLLYLKKQRDNWALTALAQWRILDFLTQTEHLPELGFHWIGEPLGNIASLYSESHVGWVRYRPDDRLDRRPFSLRTRWDPSESSDSTFRFDERAEVQIPIKFTDPYLNVVPFAAGRYTYWDDTPNDGALDRLWGTTGVRASSQFWRTFPDIQSELFDVQGIRHIIRPEVTAWASASNRDPRHFYPFDEGIEDIHDAYGTSLALRQVWQTHRGGAGEEDEEADWRNVDLLSFDVEVNLFGNAVEPHTPIGRFYPTRPENSVPRNHVKTDLVYRVSDTTALLSDANFDLDDGDMDTFALSYAVERTPRWSYFIGYRWIHETDSNLLGAGTNYRINEKYTLAVRSYFDLDRGKTATMDLTIIRKFPRWYAAFTFALDEIEEDIGVGVTVWPEGAPQATIGSRRYTSLSESTGIRPQD